MSRRTTGIIVAVAVELALIILLFTISQSRPEPTAPIVTISTFDSGADDAAEDEPAPEKPDQAEPAENAPTPQPQPEEPQPVETPAPANPPPIITRPNRPAPVLIPLDRDDLAKFDITPKAPAAPAPPSQSYGPANTGRSSRPDSQRVGTAPNGEPMYAARWFREPRDDELSGYLSTADGPGWAMITCQTAPQYRVENCVILGESPRGSNIGRAVKAAAWQFQVRPARINGQDQVGSWVRIRFDYTEERR